jgi:hypothetical protein
MATKKKPTAAPDAAQGDANEAKKKMLTVSNERMHEIMESLAFTLDGLHTKTHEDILAGRELILLGARQMVKDNPQVNSIQFICQLCNDLQQYLVRNFPRQLPVGEA